MQVRTTILTCVFLAIATSGIYCLYIFNPSVNGRFSIQSNPRSKEEADAHVSQRKEDEARAKFAFVSLTERLPKGKPISLRKPLDAESNKRWQDLDRHLASHGDGRAELMKALHEKTRRFFINSPGAGPRRNFTPTPEETLLDAYSDNDAPQPGSAADFPLSPGENLSRIKADDSFDFVHELGLWGFLYPQGFGYVKDRGHVSGFASHGFRYDATRSSVAGRHPMRKDEKRWRVDHVQLVGLLTHDQPLVYMTDKMPSMDQIKQGKTRGLDFFEEIALPALADGEDLYIVQKNDTLRMLGAIRATKTCQKCHDAEIGDMLGAFSYTLRPAPVETKADE